MRDLVWPLLVVERELVHAQGRRSWLSNLEKDLGPPSPSDFDAAFRIRHLIRVVTHEPKHSVRSYPDVGLHTVPCMTIVSGYHWADVILIGLVFCRHLVRLTSPHEVRCNEASEPESHEATPLFGYAIPVLYSCLSMAL